MVQAAAVKGVMSLPFVCVKLGTVFCAGTVASQPPTAARFRKTLRSVREGDCAAIESRLPLDLPFLHRSIDAAAADPEFLATSVGFTPAFAIAVFARPLYLP
jgi:hypothetical protein